MPFTVITLTNVQKSLRGDLSKWMQEIASGVYVGNFNSRVREQLWRRVCDNISQGEATLSYAFRNEIGYFFKTYNTKQRTIDADGVPLVKYPLSSQLINSRSDTYGFSSAYRSHMIRKKQLKSTGEKNVNVNLEPLRYVIVDVETDGLDETKNHIIEIGAIKILGSRSEEFHELINVDAELPTSITELTGLHKADLEKEGIDIEEALEKFEKFTGELPVVGYNIKFDLRFLESEFYRSNKSWRAKNYIDILTLVRQEKLFLESYKFSKVLESYGIDEKVPHRALADAKLLQKLILKLNGFEDFFIRKV